MTIFAVVKRLLGFILSIILLSGSLMAQEADTLSRREALKLKLESEQFKPRVAVAGGLVFVTGAVIAGERLTRDGLDAPIRDAIVSLQEDWGKTRIDDFAQFVPTAGYLGVGLFAESEHNLLERSMIATNSTLVMTAAVNALKYTVRRLRPDGSTKNSFPSGHTATAFMGAELVMMEYGGWYGIAAYTFATGVGLMRMYNNRHWFSDVMAGAAIGVLSAHAGYWLLPLERRWFKMEGKSSQLTVVPSAGGLALAYTF